MKQEVIFCEKQSVPEEANLNRFHLCARRQLQRGESFRCLKAADVIEY